MADRQQSEHFRSGGSEPYMSSGSAQNSSYKHSRMTSTVAQSFAGELDSMFGLGMGTGAGIDTLSQTVEQKKATVNSGQSELEKLEAKLRETEQRLAKVSRGNSPSRQADSGASASETAQKQAHPLSQRPSYPADRPPTGPSRPQAGRENTEQMMAGMPGAFNQTPRESSGRDDYVMIDHRPRR
ncbi:hypothetical protein LTR37_020851 [Vermiconidia calcicola]|uniref:Uncharacterized protein n=1 Tax=Vermiconidia calcicola TaxID=1690605 RepID=A0ACC3MA87_9PEZI|nr:hypothetical protein LTR37_020851 [Vermiconidia calcicola]